MRRREPRALQGLNDPLQTNDCPHTALTCALAGSSAQRIERPLHLVQVFNWIKCNRVEDGTDRRFYLPNESTEWEVSFSFFFLFFTEAMTRKSAMNASTCVRNHIACQQTQTHKHTDNTLQHLHHFFLTECTAFCVIFLLSLAGNFTFLLNSRSFANFTQMYELPHTMSIISTNHWRKCAQMCQARVVE